MVMIMVAPDGTFSLNDMAIPITMEKKLIRVDINIILLNWCVTRFAMLAGMVSNEMMRIMPTALIAKTMASAMSTAREYPINFTGTF